MKGLISFHPVDLAFFDEIVAPILRTATPQSGAASPAASINAEPLVARAALLGRNAAHVRRYPITIQRILSSAGPKKVDPSDSLLLRFKTRLDAYDYKPDEATKLLAPAFNPDLHLFGRPFFIFERSAQRVAERAAAYAAAADVAAVDRLAREQLDLVSPKLTALLDPLDEVDVPSEHTLKSGLAADLKALIALAKNPLESTIAEEFPWKAVAAHARLQPVWVGRDVDGLETVCRAVGILPPLCLVPARRLFFEAIEARPALGEPLHVELASPRDLGAFVPPSDIPELLEFLAASGGRIIQAAAKAGEGPAATALLQKIKECATYAGAHGFGYLEASGIVPPGFEERES